MDITWFERGNKKAPINSSDIYITVTPPSKTAGKSERVRFRFSEGVHALYFDGHSRMLIGTAGKRLYFKPVETVDGYFISTISRSKHLRSMSVSNQELADFIHDNPTLMESTLQYDEKQKQYYIEAA